jgi:hypothetical protein
MSSCHQLPRQVRISASRGPPFQFNVVSHFGEAIALFGTVVTSFGNVSTFEDEASGRRDALIHDRWLSACA